MRTSKTSGRARSGQPQDRRARSGQPQSDQPQGRRALARGHHRRRKRSALIVALAVVALATIVGGVAFALHARDAARVSAARVNVPAAAMSATTTREAAAEAAAQATASATSVIEVPNVVGQDVATAGKLLVAAGFKVHRVASTVTSAKAGRVLTQDPHAGVKADSGTTIKLVYAAARTSAAGGSTSANVAAPGASAGASGIVVCLDPGHQAKADLATEPIGPGSATRKAKVSGGASGYATHQSEHAFALAVALKVRARLQAAGVKVVMTRTGERVDVSNIQRAKIANAAHAALCVRIHADGSTDHAVHGVSTLYPAGNSWVRPIQASSLAAAKRVHAAVLAATGATSRGIVARSDLTGFNWSSVPVCLVECGFLSNAAEDRALATSAYQDKLAAGIASGILSYVKR